MKDPAEAATSFLRLGGLVKFSARRATAEELKAEGLPPDDPAVAETGDVDDAAAATTRAAPEGAAASPVVSPRRIPRRLRHRFIYFFCST